MKTFNVVWTERMSVNIEAETADEAVDKAWNSEYDENGVSSEMDGSIEAYEITIK
jgi:hypothetical protein